LNHFRKVTDFKQFYKHKNEELKTARSGEMVFLNKKSNQEHVF